MDRQLWHCGPWETEAGGALGVQSSLHSELQTSQKDPVSDNKT